MSIVIVCVKIDGFALIDKKTNPRTLGADRTDGRSLWLRVQLDVFDLPEKESLVQGAGLDGVFAASPYLSLTSITLFNS